MDCCFNVPGNCKGLLKSGLVLGLALDIVEFYAKNVLYGTESILKFIK